jgi:hypothetical protein
MPFTSSDVIMQVLRTDVSLVQLNPKCWSNELNTALQSVLYQSDPTVQADRNGRIYGRADGCSIPVTHVALILDKKTFTH